MAKKTALEVGRKAPAFALLATGGREVSLVDQAWVLGALPVLLVLAITLYGSSAAMIAAMVFCGAALCVGPRLEWPSSRGARPQAGTSNEV